MVARKYEGHSQALEGTLLEVGIYSKTLGFYVVASRTFLLNDFYSGRINQYQQEHGFD